MNILSRFYEYTWKRWDSIKFQECGSCIYFCKRKFVWALLLVSIIVNFLFCFLTDVNSHRCCSWPITVASWDIDLFCWFLSVFIWLIIPIFYKPETIHSFPPQNKKKIVPINSGWNSGWKFDLWTELSLCPWRRLLTWLWFQVYTWSISHRTNFSMRWVFLEPQIIPSIIN